MKEKYDVIVIGSGLAGLTTAYKLAKGNKKVLVLEKEKILGGRTSSWNDNGMLIESGFHRHIGFYKEFPNLLTEVGIDLNKIISWENEAEIKLAKDKSIVLGIAPFYAPFTFLKDTLGNRELLSIKEKFSLLKLFINGMKDYAISPENLDTYSVLDYANKLKIEKSITNYIATSLSTGIFFLPKEEYSAKLFFGLFYPSIFSFPKMRIGAYKEGMRLAFVEPLAEAIEKNNGLIKKSISVKKIIIKNNQIIGVKTDKGNYYADSVVLATDIDGAQNIVKNTKNSKLNYLLKIPTLSAITVQLELTEPIMPLDRTTFAPTTIIASYTEESRTTFKNSKGRASIILVSKKEHNKWNDKKILDIVIKEFRKIGIEVKDKLIDYRIVRHTNKFYDFSKGNDKYRPQTITPVKGLFLAGDYTKQKWYATMEGAVTSGINASKELLK